MGQSMVAITSEDCTGCDLCIPHCPFEALLPLVKCPPNRKKRPVIVRMEACVGCLSCIGSCPTDALYEIAMPVNANISPLIVETNDEPTELIVRWGPNGLNSA